MKASFLVETSVPYTTKRRQNPEGNNINDTWKVL